MQVQQKPTCHEPNCSQQAIMFMKNSDGSDNFMCWPHYTKSRNMKPNISLKLEKNEEEDTGSI